MKAIRLLLTVVIILSFGAGCSKTKEEVSSNTSSYESSLHEVSSDIENDVNTGEPPLIISFEDEDELQKFIKLKDNPSVYYEMSFRKYMGDDLPIEEYYAFADTLKTFSYPKIDKYDCVYYEYYAEYKDLIIRYEIDNKHYNFVLNIVDEDFDNIIKNDKEGLKEISVKNVERAAVKYYEGKILIIYEDKGFINKLLIFTDDKYRHCGLEWFKTLDFKSYE